MHRDPLREPDRVTDLGRKLSFWLDDELDRVPGRPALEGQLDVDVAVVGGGITGLTTAALAAGEGLSVALVEQGGIGSGTTGHTTAKVTSQHGLAYSRLEGLHGEEAARLYGEANEEAKETIAHLAEGADCDLRRRDSYVYAATVEHRDEVEEEARTAARLGLPAEFVSDVPAPLESYGAVRFECQAEIHPMRYLRRLAERVEQAGGRVFEGSRARGWSRGTPQAVTLETGGELRARHVVVATLLPFLDRGLHFARAHPERSYALAVELEDLPPQAMLLSTASGPRSFRSHPGPEEEVLIVAGEGHSVGDRAAGDERFERLAEFASAHWQVRRVSHRWSSQDYVSVDGLPYVGAVDPTSPRTWVATGFGKWGLTGGTAAARLIVDEIVGRTSPYRSLFGSLRLPPLRGLPLLVEENAKVAFRFADDWIRERGDRSIEELAPGEGAIVEGPDGRVAGFRDAGGTLHAVSSRCTHLGCQVRWNAAEASWDCPCHGSRFGVDGEVLNGPATSPLEPRPGVSHGTNGG